MNGSTVMGIPTTLAGEAIPVESRVIAACDAYHAMTRDRPYSHSRSREVALTELRRCAGSQFDPRVVDALEQVIKSEAGKLVRQAA